MERGAFVCCDVPTRMTGWLTHSEVTGRWDSLIRRHQVKGRNP